MAEKANLTPKEGDEVEAQKTVTPEVTPEGQEAEGTAEETAPEAPESESKEEDTESFYKKRASESAHEAHRLLEENKTLKTQIAEQAYKPNLAVETPSDKEMTEQVPDWDLYSLGEQKLLKEQIFLKRKLSALESNQNQTSAEIGWGKDFDDLVLRPEFSVLTKRKAEFKLFCSKNPQTSISVLAQSFLFNDVRNIGAKEEKVKLERTGLEKATGGDRTYKPPEMSSEEREDMRKKDPKKYEKLVKSGVIK